jgi:hypothetical protein
MPVSTIDIVNDALDLIGQAALVSLEVKNPLAERVRRKWPSVRDDVLRAHPWKCATKRTQLQKLLDAPLFGFKNQFQLPGDFLRLVQTEPECPCAVENNKLMADVDKLAIAYVFRLEDMTIVDSTLRKCFELKLASELCFGTTASAQQSQSLYALYRDKLREARGYDSREGAGTELPFTSNWASAKLG